MNVEQNYDFRKRLLTTNEKGVCANRISSSEYLSLESVEITCISGKVMENAKKDFIDFLKTSACIDNPEKKGGIKINITISDELEHYKERVIKVTDDGIEITAKDERGAACSLFDLEELMILKKAPAIKKDTYRNYPYFAPRMAHSAYDIDLFPNEHLLNFAKEGLDAILVYVVDKDRDSVREADFDDLIERANSYGLDVYAYSYIDNFVHPSDEGAKEKYAEAFGGVFKAHKGFKGIILVGESILFPSKDEHTSGQRTNAKDEYGIPYPKYSPAYYPCSDYPEWLSLVRDSIRAEKPDADIVFWTYNWGNIAKEERVKLLNAIPTDVSLLVTFELFELYKLYDIWEEVRDYSLSVTKAGECFISEAEIAKQRGIRLYAMANTGGRTWDFGVMPYQPAIYAWKERYDSVLECKEKYNLSGLMECHHYGYFPSFITRFSKYCFESIGDYLGGKSTEDYLISVLNRFFGYNTETLTRGLKKVSEANYYQMPSAEMQYSPMRVGPAYPFNLERNLRPKDKPGVKNGIGICVTKYENLENHFGSIHSVRNPREIRALKKCAILYREGREILNTITDKNENLQRLINLIEFAERCVITAANVKEFFLLKTKLFCTSNRSKCLRIIKKMKKLCTEEIENVKATIPVVEKDSSLGYEASMDYQCDKAHLEWKLKQIDFMLEHELIKFYEKNLKY